jgi:RNA polymerase sigma-70 factor (ECF subfamily)
MRRTTAKDSSDRNVDDDLICRVADGDAAAWPMLLDRHLRPIVGVGWYMLGDRAEAEDVAQECFVRLLAKAETWKPGGPKLRTWLHRVAINLCIDRQRARKPVSLDALGDGDGVVPIDPGTAGRMDQRIVVQRALDGLPEKQKMAMVLIYYQGFSNREAAELLETSVEAVESLLARARRALRQRLLADLPDLLGASG